MEYFKKKKKKEYQFKIHFFIDREACTTMSNINIMSDVAVIKASLILFRSNHFLLYQKITAL